MPEGDTELPDDGLPDELDDEDGCPNPPDMFPMPKENLPDE